ncbi:MAG: M3 family metallopeptidase [Bacteroidales bacterium]|nr:M3 family metallopeptidase [Bacteroidales bacterium]
MKRNILLFILLSAVMLNLSKNHLNAMDNPFFSVFDTPFGVPPFDQIKPEHFLPALDSGISMHNLEIQAIITCKEKPDFENTIVALDRSGSLLKNVSDVFSGLYSADGTPEIQALSGDFSAKLSAHANDIGLNSELFERISRVWEDQEKLNLNEEQFSLLDQIYKGYIRNGVNLPEQQKNRLRAINLRLTELTDQFDKNLLAETNAFQLVIESEADLAGLPDAVIQSAAAAATDAGMDGKWLITTHKPSMIPFLQYAENKELRTKIYTAYCKRGSNDNEHDNKAIISEIANLRVEKAHLLGFPSYAAYQLDNRMAGTPEAVYELLDKVWEPAIRVAKMERDEMQTIIDAEGGGFRLGAEDWWYYAEKLRNRKYNLDENDIRPYFELNHVVNGVFAVSGKLYGLRFVKIGEDFPKPHPDSEAFEVYDADDTFMGILYMDYYTRSTKGQGAWCGTYRDQYIDGENNIRPVVTIVTNFANPVGGAPVLLSLDEVETLFHEFGHGLHNLLSNVSYSGISCTSVKRDFVELPSQIMENWAMEREVLDMYATHYETGKTMPDDLFEKIYNARHFNQGFSTVEYVAASYLDMNYHILTETKELDINKFEDDYLSSIDLIPEIVSRYRSTYFKHIWSHGYSAGYYSYLWAEVLDQDAFEAFKENGLFDSETAKSFRTNILEKGGSADPMELYIRFRGRKPETEPLLKNRGLL